MRAYLHLRHFFRVKAQATPATPNPPAHETRPSSTGLARRLTARMCGQKGVRKDRPSPADRRRPGSKHHVICEGRGIPLGVTLTAANRNDITELLPLVDRVPPTGRYGKFRPKALLADRAYDSRHHRNALRERGITPRIAKRKTSYGSGLGKERWVVERTRSHGYTASAAWTAATSDAPTSTKPSSPSALHSSATNNSNTHFVRHS